MSYVKKSIAERARHQRQYDRRMNEIQMQMQEGEVDRGIALDADLVVTESSGMESEKHDTNSRCENDTHSEDADIKPVNYKEPMAQINELKAQLHAKNTTISNLKKQIKNMLETSNEAKVKNDIDVIETINIELEHRLAKLLAKNELLYKENEHLKHTYKDLYDSIKKTRIQTQVNNDSLIAQVNSNTN
ncbi:hypothetical protein Tco_0855301 [Tanacetum coccineum]